MRDRRPARCTGPWTWPGPSLSARSPTPTESKRPAEKAFSSTVFKGYLCAPDDRESPKRDHGDPQSFRLRSEGNGKLVRAEGLEPSRTLRSNGFSYPATAFAAATAFAMGFGVWTIPSPCPDWFRVSGAARLVSTPSR